MNTLTKHLRKRFALLSAFLILITGSAFAQSAEAGEKLFKTNCAVCHRMDDKMLTGPGLAGVMERVPSRDWLKSWIKNNVALIQAGDDYAVKVFEANNQKAMNVFEHLKDEEIESIVMYIENPPVKGEEAGTVAFPYEASWKTPGTYEEESNTLTWVFVLVFLLVVIAIFSGINRSLKKMKAERMGQPIEEDKPWYLAIHYWAVNNKKYSGPLMFVVVIFLAVAGWNSVINIGVFGGATHEQGAVAASAHVTENYKPEQPIKFPHHLHAGKNEIDCQYCHSSARNSKTSGIPSANVCMNCHKGVSESQYEGSGGTAEIQKIYDHVGWDPEKMEYDPNAETKPIEWVKVHNLPDFVYFNHSQHVTVGKIECQTCHGPVETMDQAEQFAPLTMKWCINCHRETEIAFEDDPKSVQYYDRIHNEAKEAFKHQEDFKFTVETIGGLECAKCHY